METDFLPASFSLQRCPRPSGFGLPERSGVYTVSTALTRNVPKLIPVSSSDKGWRSKTFTPYNSRSIDAIRALCGQRVDI